jgi:hypothetical protein
METLRVVIPTLLALSGLWKKIYRLGGLGTADAKAVEYNRTRRIAKVEVEFMSSLQANSMYNQVREFTQAETCANCQIVEDLSGRVAY